MAFVSGYSIGVEVCDTLGIDARLVRTITIHLDCRKPTEVIIERFDIDGPPANQPSDCTTVDGGGFTAFSNNTVRVLTERYEFPTLGFGEPGQTICRALGLQGLPIRGIIIRISVSDAVAAESYQFVDEAGLREVLRLLAESKAEDNVAAPGTPLPGGASLPLGPGPHSLMEAMAIAVLQGDRDAALMLADEVLHTSGMGIEKAVSV